MSQTIAVVGGTGNLGSAIAWRLAKAGHQVIIGSRSAEAAIARAEELGHGLTGMANADAAQAGDIVLVTVPFSAQAATLADIKPHVAGKIVVDTTVPLVPPKVMRVQLPEEGSAAICASNLLGDDVRLVAAFHNVAAHRLAEDGFVDCDILKEALILRHLTLDFKSVGNYVVQYTVCSIFCDFHHFSAENIA